MLEKTSGLDVHIKSGGTDNRINLPGAPVNSFNASFVDFLDRRTDVVYILLAAGLEISRARGESPTARGPVWHKGFQNLRPGGELVLHMLDTHLVKLLLLWSASKCGKWGLHYVVLDLMPELEIFLHVPELL